MAEGTEKVKPDFRVENGVVVSSTHWPCHKCRCWSSNYMEHCYKCRYPKGWLADEDEMFQLGWVKVDKPQIVDVK